MKNDNLKLRNFENKNKTNFKKSRLFFVFFIFSLFIFNFHFNSASADITTGLVSHSKLDETGGTTAADSAGTNTGTVSGATFTTGKIGNGLSFNGTGDVVKPVSNFPTFTAFTAAAWVKVDDLTAARGIFTSRNTSNNSFRFRVSTNGSILLCVGDASTVDCSIATAGGTYSSGKILPHRCYGTISRRGEYLY